MAMLVITRWYIWLKERRLGMIPRSHRIRRDINLSIILMIIQSDTYKTSICIATYIIIYIYIYNVYSYIYIHLFSYLSIYLSKYL